MHDYPIIVFAALLAYVFGLFSKLAERSPVTGPMVFVAVGLLGGPWASDGWRFRSIPNWSGWREADGAFPTRTPAEGVRWREAFRVATTVQSFDQARFVVEAMEMLAHYNEKIAPIKSLEKNVPFAGRTGSGSMVVAGPVDFLTWNERINRFASRPDLKARERLLWIRGEATPLARQELAGLGWTLKEKNMVK
jgi:hypothetical protein